MDCNVKQRDRIDCGRLYGSILGQKIAMIAL